MKTNLLILVSLFLFTATTHAAGGVDFDRYFTDSTLRIDYTHTGNAKEESFAIDRLYKQDKWAGSLRNLLDASSNGINRDTHSMGKG